MLRTLKIGAFASLLIFFLAACEYGSAGTGTPLSDLDKPAGTTPSSPTSTVQPSSTASSTPTSDSGSESGARSEIYIEGSELEVAESYPVQVYLHVWGNTPTPCHKVKYEITGPDELNRINVEMWTEADPGVICIQVLSPFDERIQIPMGGQPDGSYDVWLNGEYVGTFDYPA